MQETTREILNETMARSWSEVWAGATGRPTFHGTAAEAVADFTARHAVEVRSHRLVMDDGDWTIRATFTDGSVATIFAA